MIFQFNFLNAQCDQLPGTITGNVQDEVSGNGVGNVLVKAFNQNGELAIQAMTDFFGNYELSGLGDGENFRLEFVYGSNYGPAIHNEKNKTDIQFVTVPACGADFAVLNPDEYCAENAQVALTCFVRGADGENDELETIVYTDFDFGLDSKVQKYSNKAMTGSVWGLTYKKSSRTLFSAAFIKQYAGLTANGHGAIFASNIKTGETYLHTRLDELGQDIGTILPDHNDAAYGAQAGKIGLGGLEISEDEETLYVINIYNNTLVSLSSSNPTAETTTAFSIPDPGCVNGDTYKAFAITRSGDKLYVGVTCTSLESGEAGELSVTVFEFDIATETFSPIFSTDYPKGYWKDLPANSRKTQAWLTDLGITDEGNMILSLSDRIAHRYADPITNGRLDDQHPDILLAYNDNGVWKLEDNAVAGSLIGSHPNVDEGPGGGEFFGYDYWISGPDYHSEIATGSILVLPGTGSVVATVFDPDFDSYTGGLHKYSTSNGDKLGVGIIYEHTNDPQFGKASGLGDIVAICGILPQEIGNLLWIDENNNGVQDAGEPVLSNIALSLYDADCNLVGTTQTDDKGNYYFNDSNVDLNQDGLFDGLDLNADYYVVVSDDAYDATTGILTVDGNAVFVTKQGLGFGSNPERNDSDAKIGSDLCDAINGKPYAKVQTGSSGQTDHSFDLGFSPEGDFDLALKKELVGDYGVQYGDTVIFKITVINQGGVTADEVVVNDYLASGYTFDENANAGWKDNDGILQTLIGAPLLPGAEVELFIKLVVKEGAKANDLVNYAEISIALDASGNPLVDIDSTPDDIVDNDNGGILYQATDNEVNDDGTIDEDDHDPAGVRIFDLALRKVLKNPEEEVVANSAVDFSITVYNQGSLTAQSVTISDYIPQPLFFNPDINDGWELLDDSTIVYTIDQEIVPSSSHTVDLTLEVGSLSPNTAIINYSEIRSAIDEFGNEGTDVDSQADGIRDNDNGGSPYDATDNEIDDHGDIDEDDHDPAIINTTLFDLALRKTTVSGSVKAGENVEFNITVINQGELAAKTIGIVDYIPEGLSLNDDNWNLVDPTMAKLLFVVEGGLQPGDSIVKSITLTVDPSFNAGTLINFAEIDLAYGMNDQDLSNKDIDSRPDDLRTNDIGGLPFGPTDNQVNDPGFEDEDDHDPAYVYVFASLVNESCICLENASTTEAGQFGEIIEIIAPSGLEWYIHEADGLYDAAVSPALAPVSSDFATGAQYPLTNFTTGPGGYMLLEYPIGATGNSAYYITGVRVDGEEYSVVVRNNIGDQDIITGGACNYETNAFTAPAGVCAGSIETFCVEGFDAADMNVWSVVGDATIVGADNEACVQVEFGATVGDEVNIVFTSGSTEACYAPAMETVTIGASAGFLSCLGNVNISLNDDCELGLTPSSLLTIPVTPDAVYSIIYSTAEGFMLPENPDWSKYLGREIMAKVMDNCSGNSCWSFITIEDKQAPEIECFDLTVSCIEMMDYNGPFVLDNCFGEGTLIPTTKTNTALECDPDFTFRLTRGFKAQDDLGNTSNECIQTIMVERPDLDAIVAPANRTIEESSALSCVSFDTIAGGVPDPAVYGVPTLEGIPLYPGAGQFCNLGVNFKDTVFPQNGCVKKIMRQWFIFEWHCEFGRLDTITQIFNIADMSPPSITCLGDMKVSSNGSTCEGDILLPAALVSDDCSSSPRVDIAYPGGFLENSNGGLIQLPIGIHEVTYTVYDDCLNSSSCSIMVEVEDRTAPIAVCHQNTVLSVRTDGTTYALASVFDDGSYDDCGFDRIEVRRMDAGMACDSVQNEAFSDRVEFCCADVGVETVVIMRVYDVEGNANQCMVNVQIQDKNPPSLIPPANITVDCQEVIELDDLSGFGVATATDNCMNPIISEQVISGLNECRTGVIERRFTATDGNGTAIASQFITVITEDTFDLDNITWPLNYTTTAACDPGSLKPDNLPAENGFPILDEGFCSQVAITYSDKVFNILNSETACQKIIRSWIVEDFCQPIEENKFASWRYDQAITISNDVAPVITSSCEDVTVCSTNEDCATGPITLTAGASDDCTPGGMMRYSYYVDFGDDGGEFDVEDFGSGDTVTVMGEYPIGTHSILFVFEDLCGNSATCRQTFTIENCHKPSVVCHDGISVALNPMDTDNDGELDDEMAIVKARLFDASSFHPCGDDLLFSFTENPADSCKTFSCDDIGLNDVTIYGITESGQTSFCVTTLDVQDNNDVDLCRGVEECIVMPTDITITECVADFSPEVIGGGPTIDPDCICTNTTIEYVDRDSTDLTNTCTIIIRDWTVTFNCGFPKSFASKQVITKYNDRAPILDCPENITVSSDDACNGTVIVGIPEVLSDCTTDFTITNDSEYADSNTGAASGMYPVGIDTVTYTVTDICGNVATCDVIITVTDSADPICDVNDITIAITDEFVDVTVSAEDIDNGSFDECGLVVDKVLVPTVFGCADAGVVQDVTLTITDDSGNSTECFAQVTVVDSVAPVCLTKTTTVNLFDDASVTIPPTILNDGSYDPCGELVDIQVMGSVDCSMVGQDTVILALVDDSGNRTECKVGITVRDLGTPECRLIPITVQLDGSDQATITGADIDNGSNDVCSGLDTLILDKTTFNCDDIGDVTVNVMAVDSAGNSTNCSTVVTVTANPTLMCIAEDITVYLGTDGEANITAEDIDGGSGIPCAEDAELSIDRTTFFCNDVALPREVTLTITSVLGDTSCTAMVMVLDTIPPIVNCPADLTVDCQDLSDDLSVYGTVNTNGSNCVVLAEDITVTPEFNLNECGLGTVNRVFVAVGINGNSNTCTQIITVENADAFDEDNITWPTSPLAINQCTSIHPDSIDSRPIINVDSETCTNIGMDYVDVNLTMNTNCEDTIRRTWTVVDSCPSPFNVFTFDQMILISDEMAPVITTVDTVFLCDTLVNYTFEVEDCNETTVTYFSSVGAGDGTTVTGDFEEGNTTVYLDAMDRCGNNSTDSVVINIVLDTVPPVIVCINRNIVIEEDGSTQVLPSDSQWFFRVNDNTTDSSNLMYSFDPNFDMTNDTLAFTCDSVIVKSHVIDIYVKDKGGNVSTCAATYVTTDPNGVCVDGLATIQGLISTENKIEIPEVEVHLINGDTYEMTNDGGFYNFPQMTSGNVYELKPEKDTDHMAGVTSLDLVLIQRHILGTQKISSTYQLIAADINKSGVITGKDLLDLKKNILNITNKFPNNKSWRFVDEDYQFVDAQNPFNELFPESYMIYDMAGPVYKNFVGIKVGDVNGSVQLGGKGNVVTRSTPIALSLDDEILSAKDVVMVPVTVNRQISLAGYQLSFALESGLDLMDIESDYFDINGSDYSVTQYGTQKLVTMVVVPQEDIAIEEGSELLRLKLKANARVQLAEAISMNEAFSNEWYDAGLNTSDIDLRFNEEDFADANVLLQNTPNPWKDKTLISFTLGSDQQATINVYNVTGALITSISDNFKAGNNQVEFKANKFNESGVYYYELVTDQTRISKRMILIK
ncbi:hypothetical protein GCM10007940_03120 [Portibacter lacus]|uniref:DUF11 domain-containing protein n=2 Tax=Portibacter lacus TaxID=1099794 RepID=A0AA37SLT4_9BACT|nr:hypothetical protein GCM10007940_03120 [Portibacter lacus]